MDWEPAGKSNDSSSQGNMSKLPKKKSKLPIVILVIVALIAAGAISTQVKNCNRDKEEAARKAEEDAATFTWPTSGLATQLPKPEKNNGEINSNSDTYFSADLRKMSQSDYETYIQAVKDAKYTDFSGEGTDYFTALAPSGAKLSLRHDDDAQEMSITLKVEEEQSETTDEQTDDSASDTSEDASSGSSDSATVSADFKATMDGYEQFMNSYVDFMVKYKESDNAVSMAVDYTKMLAQYSEWVEKFDAIDESTLSADDAAYYLEVQARVAKKLSEVQ